MTDLPRRRRGRPPVDQRVVSRAQILDHALRAFATHGYEAMSVRALSLDLGGSPHLVRHYYGSKQALWEASVDRVLDRVRQALQPLSEHAQSAPISREVARDVLEQTIRIAVETPDLVRIALDEGRVGGPRLDHLFAKGFDPVDKTLTMIVRALRGDDAAVTPDEQQSLFFIGLVGAAAPFFASALSERFAGGEPMSNDAKEHHIRLVVDMILHQWEHAASSD